MSREKEEVFEKAKLLSFDVPQTVIHFGGHSFGVCDSDDVPERETRVVAEFKKGKQE